MATKKRARKPDVTRQRDRQATEEALQQAVGQVLLTRGASALTPSAVAAQAGVDKALIYRYFGDFESLLGEYAKSPGYWPSVEEIVPDRAALLRLPFLERMTLVMQRYAEALRKRPQTIAVLAAELADREALHPALSNVREQLGLELLQLAHDAPAELDAAALATLLTGAIHYLLIRARQVKAFNGIDLASDAGWQRVSSALHTLLAPK
jgi:AcrR family transcriptional regulator